MKRSPEDLSDVQVKFADVREQLAVVLASPERDEARVLALDLRARELRRRIDGGRGLGEIGRDGFYGSGY
jgi:hypothetical protein